MQGARGRLQHVPQRGVQFDSGLALTHVSSLTYSGVCHKTDITSGGTNRGRNQTDFVSLQVRDLERSAAFYEQYLGLKRSVAGPPHAVVFDTKPIAFAVRDVVPGVDLDAIAQPGQGMALSWLHAPDAQDIHDALAAAGTEIVSAPVDGPFGRTFTFTPTPTSSPGDPSRPRLSPVGFARRLENLVG